jgi:NTE family protein
MSRPTLRQWLQEGPFTLALSSGFFGFYAHAGMLRALEDAAITPARVTGSSAGALAGGLWAAGVPAETLTRELRALSRRDFWDPGFGPGLLRGRLFRERVQSLLPVSDFAACRTPVAISVFDVIARRTRVLSQGPLVPAIQASCSVPLLFHPVWVEGRACVDGGVLDRPALAAVAPDERVLCHHLTSRVPSARGRSALQRDAPRRPSLVALICDGLPRVDPFNLLAGRRALELAAFATLRALTRPIGDGLIREA